MKKFASGLLLAAFASSCILNWAMLSLVVEIRNAGRVLPWFTNLCISIRPLFLLLPFVAAGYFLWTLFDRKEDLKPWMGATAVTMAVWMLLVLPAMSTSFLLMIDPVKAAIGVH